MSNQPKLKGSGPKPLVLFAAVAAEDTGAVTPAMGGILGVLARLGGWYSDQMLTLTVGTVTLLAGVALQPAELGPAQVLVAMGSAILIVACVHGHFATIRSVVTEPVVAGGMDKLGERFERGIESLKDMQWELRENEARYRDLLDSQQDVIVRRDSDRRLIFVNRSFCRVFGVEISDVIGSQFELLRLAVVRRQNRRA